MRYFAVGEYGPRTFRPHYHAVFFFNEDKIFERFSENVYKAWKFGRIDCQLSQSRDSCKYCSQYINSFGFSPSVLRRPWNRSFCLHSSFFGVSKNEDYYSKVENLSFESISRRIFNVSNEFKTISPPLSLQNSLFPKCFAYGSSNDDFNLCRYTLYLKLSDIYFRYLPRQEEVLPPSVLYDYFFNKVDFNSVVFSNGIYLKDLFVGCRNLSSAFLKSLYVSKCFLNNCISFRCSYWYYYHRIIKQYYSDKSYYLLSKGLREVEDFSNSIEYNSKYLINFYSNLPYIESSKFDSYFENRSLFDSLDSDIFYFISLITLFASSVGLSPSDVNNQYLNYEEFPLYVSNYLKQSEFYNNNIKHRHLNDLNKIFYEKE